MHAAQGELFAAAAPQVMDRRDVESRERLEGEVRDALLTSLWRSAERRWRGPHALAEVVERVSAVEATPLVFSAAFLENRWLGVDVLKHRPAAIAVACIERTIGSWERADITRTLLGAVHDWQGIFSPGGRASRALRKTLALHGETAAMRDLWALRMVPLSRPVQSALHLQVLAERARVARHGDHALEHLALIEHETGERLQEFIDRVARELHQPAATPGEKIHLLCELLAQHREPAGGQRLAGIVRQGLAGARLSRHGDVRRATTLPPIPLPTAPGVTFLDTVGAVVQEGEAMRHCIGTRAGAAVRGHAYLFHVDHRGLRASVEVDECGRIREVSGPGNLKNEACLHAEAVLSRWAQPLRLLRRGPAATAMWQGTGPVIPGGTPVRTVRDAMDVVLRWSAREGVDPAQVVRWFMEHAFKAEMGRAWIVETEDELIAVDGAHGVMTCFRALEWTT